MVGSFYDRVNPWFCQLNRERRIRFLNLYDVINVNEFKDWSMIYGLEYSLTLFRFKRDGTAMCKYGKQCGLLIGYVVTGIKFRSIESVVRTLKDWKCHESIAAAMLDSDSDTQSDNN